MNNEKYQQVVDLLLSKKEFLSYTDEDNKLIVKLWDKYWKKRKGNLKSSSEVLAAAVLWQYSSNNFLWEYDKTWSQKSLAELFQVNPKTIGENSRQIKKLLKIDYFDDRFCRKDVADKNPFKEMAVLPSGFILSKDDAINQNLPFIPLKKSKEDYYYDGMDFLNQNNEKKAKYYFKKALEIDDEYIDAHNGMGTVYWWDNLNKAKEWYKKAYELTQKQFNHVWPEEIEWGILENRQYLRAIQYYGLALWREKKNEEAMKLFKLLLKLNKNDNQGSRYIIAALYAGIDWEKMENYEDWEKSEKLLEEQNKKHNFWE
ncbi:MAG: DUF6398 domain-containing protein [Candidatus Woesearchaeota archaeon]